MTKAKDTADAERGARRRRLEALRGDCARADLTATLSQRRTEGGANREVELEDPVLVADGEVDTRRARVLLERLGAILEEVPEAFKVLRIEAPAPSEFRRARLIGTRALLERASWRTVMQTRTGLWGADADDLEALRRADVFSRTSERRVPDIRAAIAELCDELLEVKPSARRRRLGEIGKLAWYGLATDFEQRNKRRPSGKEMARLLDIHPSNFSRGIGRTKDWKNYQAQAVRDPKREPKR
jgi:hypothetical protein